MEAYCEPQFAQVPPFRPEPDLDAVKAALKALQAAKQPVFVVGGGVRASRAGAELVALAASCFASVTLASPLTRACNG